MYMIPVLLFVREQHYICFGIVNKISSESYFGSRPLAEQKCHRLWVTGGVNHKAIHNLLWKVKVVCLKINVKFMTLLGQVIGEPERQCNRIQVCGGLIKVSFFHVCTVSEYCSDTHRDKHESMIWILVRTDPLSYCLVRFPHTGNMTSWTCNVD